MMAFRINKVLLIVLFLAAQSCKKSNTNTITFTPPIPDILIKSRSYDWTGTLFEIDQYHPIDTVDDPIFDYFAVMQLNDTTIAIDKGTYVVIDYAKLYLVTRNGNSKTIEYSNRIYGYDISLVYHYDTKKMNFREERIDTVLGIERRLILETK